MSRPAVTFMLPAPVACTCFSQEDLRRLHDSCTSRFPPPETITPEYMMNSDLEAEILVTGWGTPKIPRDVLDRRPNLKLVAHAAGSTKHLLPETFWDRGIRLTTANGALAISVAEATLGLLIVSSKRIWQLAARTREGLWGMGEEGHHIRELYGTTVGVVSASRVGRHFLKLIRPFDVHCLLYDPLVGDEDARALGTTRIGSILELARRSDYLIVCSPSLPETRHLIGRDVLESLRDGCIVVNASRGAVIDESALIRELEKGRLFACLDVTDPEPPPEDSPLRRLPNVILTPHITGSVGDARQRQGRFVVDDVLRYVRGEPLSWELTRARWEVMA